MLRHLSVALLCAMPLAAHAKTFDLPHPTIAVTIPDTWSPKTIVDGVEASSPDDELYVSVESYDGNDSDDAIADGLKGIAESDVQVEQKSIKRESAELNGLHGITVTGNGKDKDGPVTISMQVLDVARGRSVLITVFGTPEGTKANHAELQGILASVKRTHRAN